ncbi:hypothetical protein MMPV_000952 [Pyropia vietnamensis]
MPRRPNPAVAARAVAGTFADTARTVGEVIAAPAREGAGNDLRDLEAAALRELNRAHEQAQGEQSAERGRGEGTPAVPPPAVQPDDRPVGAAAGGKHPGRPVEPVHHVLPSHRRAASSSVDEAVAAAAAEARDVRNEELIVDPVHKETPQGHAGEAAASLGLWAYPIFLFIPLLFVTLVFAIVPLGNPFDDSIGGQAVFVFVTNLAVTAAIAYLYAIAYSGMSRNNRPFRVSLLPGLVVVVLQLAVMLPIYVIRGVQNLLGILAVGLCVLGVYGTLAVTRPDERSNVWTFFTRFQLPLLFHITTLTLYMVVYRSAKPAVQGLLVFALNLFTFIFRRVMLSLLDPYPLELTMLLSGLWIQSLADMVQTFSFPQVSNPSVFGAVWVAQSFGNVALLIFVSDVWIFKLRPTIKTYVVNAFKGNFPIPPIPEPDYSFKPEDRGHSANVGSYRRRQFRFWIWKVVSQLTANLFYLVLSPVMRYGLNKERFPFGPTLPLNGWRNSMLYSGVYLVFIVIVTALGYFVLYKWHHTSFHEVRAIQIHEFRSYTYVGFVVAILTHNIILALGMLLQHYCVFSSFADCRFTNIVDQ